jgi:hypothetical protein
MKISEDEIRARGTHSVSRLANLMLDAFRETIMITSHLFRFYGGNKLVWEFLKERAKRKNLIQHIILRKSCPRDIKPSS